MHDPRPTTVGLRQVGGVGSEEAVGRVEVVGRNVARTLEGLELGRLAARVEGDEAADDHVADLRPSSDPATGARGDHELRLAVLDDLLPDQPVRRAWRALRARLGRSETPT